MVDKYIKEVEAEFDEEFKGWVTTKNDIFNSGTVEQEERSDTPGVFAERSKLKSFIASSLRTLSEMMVKEIVNELESNPNEDGSASPNIMHFIEKKQSQIKSKFLSHPKELKGVDKNK